MEQERFVEASNTKGLDLEKWVQASLTFRNLVPGVFLFSNMALAWGLGSEQRAKKSNGVW